MTARTPSLFRQLLWAATLATGFGMLWFLLVMVLATTVQEGWRGPARDWPPREDLVVRSDGTPLIGSFPRGNFLDASYRDLDGRAQAAPTQSTLMAAVYMSGAEGDARVLLRPARLGAAARGIC